jgi:L-ascorbate metabolism protein UlaG (beta-lactamase superfamily)
MKRRQFFQYAGAGLGVSLGMGWLSQQPAIAQTGTVQIRWLGHTCFSFAGGGQTLLVNPFRAIGCTAGYREPNVQADIVMISSRLLDEGVVEGLPGNPRVLSDPGIYELDGLQIEGIPIDHDRVNGFRFGTNVMWNWEHAGMNILHMGGAAAPVAVEQQILIGRPDILLIPVGGGPKAYTAQEAVDAIELLNPKLVIPTHYRTAAAAPDGCDIAEIDEFLDRMSGSTINRYGSDIITVSNSSLPGTGTIVGVFSYPF